MVSSAKGFARLLDHASPLVQFKQQIERFEILGLFDVLFLNYRKGINEFQMAHASADNTRIDKLTPTGTEASPALAHMPRRREGPPQSDDHIFDSEHTYGGMGHIS